MVKLDFYTSIGREAVLVSGERDDETGLCIYRKERGKWFVVDPAIGAMILTVSSRKKITPAVMATALDTRNAIRDKNRELYEKTERQMRDLIRKREESNV
jgi:hypothetical protein